MSWFKADDKLHSHKKAMRAGVEAMGLWVLAGSWSADQLTDGWIPDYAALRITPNAAELAARLVSAGLWRSGEVDGEPGWWFHDWEDHQPTRDEVLARRKSDAERRKRWRDARKSTGTQPDQQEDSPQESRPESRRDTRGDSRPGSVLPDPTRPDPTNKETSASHDADELLLLATPRKPKPNYEAEFEEFWKVYPLHRGKQEAKTAFIKARNAGISADVMRDGAARYAREVQGREPGQIKWGQGWINGKRWEDEPDPIPSAEPTGEFVLPDPPPEIAGDGPAYVRWAREQRDAWLNGQVPA